MGNCSSHGSNLLAAAVSGDEEAVLKVSASASTLWHAPRTASPLDSESTLIHAFAVAQILRAEPDLAYFHTFRDRSSPATLSAGP